MFSHAFGSARERRSRREHSFRPELECLEARTLLDASGGFAPVLNDVSQVVADAVHLRGAAVQQDITKMGQDVRNLNDQIRNSPAIDLARDVEVVLFGSVVSQIGAGLLAAGEATSAIGVGIPIGFAGSSLAAYGVSLQVTGAYSFYADLKLLLSGGQRPQQPAPAPTATPASVGTYSATLLPSSTGGNVLPDAPQNLTLTLKADGSGSLSISPFAGTPLTVNFPAGTAQLYSDGSVILSYETASGGIISVTDAGLINNGNALQGTFSIVSGTNDVAIFDSATLNRQN